MASGGQKKRAQYVRTLGSQSIKRIVIDKSRMNREIHIRFRESLGVKVPLATRLRGRAYLAPPTQLRPVQRMLIYYREQCFWDILYRDPDRIKMPPFPIKRFHQQLPVQQ